ncbi:MAG: YggU family protein [Deltaproteobacteria bacterium]|nr:YggU family protein [Deltaproteobacteria bacterium]
MRIRVRLQPRASRNQIVGRHGDAIKIQVQAPPVDGAANQALLTLIAEQLGVAKRAVRLVQGETSRDKVIEVDVDDEPAARLRLAGITKH